jgi:hypothetical protein
VNEPGLPGENSNAPCITNKKLEAHLSLYDDVHPIIYMQFLFNVQ